MAAATIDSTSHARDSFRATLSTELPVFDLDVLVVAGVDLQAVEETTTFFAKKIIFVVGFFSMLIHEQSAVVGTRLDIKPSN